MDDLRFPVGKFSYDGGMTETPITSLRDRMGWR